MDRAYEGNQTRALATALGFIPVVPPSQKRLEPWQYDKQLYRRRNEVERLFRRIKGFRRVIHPLQQARCDVHRRYHLCTHHRWASVVLTGPKA